MFRHLIRSMCLFAVLGSLGRASEFHPQKPFAQFVDLPAPRQFTVTPWFIYSAFQSYWAGTHEVDISQGDNEYDVEYYSGTLMLEYGLAKNWALDLTIGYVDQATRSFNPAGDVDKTSGLQDTQFGIRYQVSREMPGKPWVPDFTLRVGGMFRGTYDEEFPFAPGYGETGIEPGVFLRKSIWRSGGLYGSAAYRHMVSYAPDSVLLSAGLFQRLGRFDIMAGYRQQQALSGPDVSSDPYNLNYYNRVKEMNYMAEWGGSYTFKNGIRLQFYMNSNFDGRNTGEKLTYGGYVSIPLPLKGH